MGDYKEDVIEKRLCEEVKLIEKKLMSVDPGKMDEVDLRRLDLLYHTLKSKAGYEEKKEMQEYGYDQSQMSGRRGYSRMSGYYDERPDWSGAPYPRYPRW